MQSLIAAYRFLGNPLGRADLKREERPKIPNFRSAFMT